MARRVLPGVAVVVGSAAILLIGFEAFFDLDGVTAAWLAIAIGLLTGFAVGRFWVLLLPLALVGGLAVVAIFFPSECRPEDGCREELPLEAGLLILAFYLLWAEALLGVGVIARMALDPSKRVDADR